MDDLQFNLQDIKLIVGLGNIGREYIGTRHNIGFEFLEALAHKRFTEEKKLKTLLINIKLSNANITLAKPITMMNSSGEAVQLIKNFYKFEDKNILIVHDDLDLLLGNYKLQFAKGPKVHNGIASIENRLGTNKFWRLRLGVENRTIDIKRFVSGATYVLSRFKNDEIGTLNKVFERIIDEKFTNPL